MTERELFAAYRVVDHYEAACACGDTITAEHSDEGTVAEAIATHSESAVHQQWRTWQEAVEALKRPTRHPCPCHEHGAA